MTRARLALNARASCDSGAASPAIAGDRITELTTNLSSSSEKTRLSAVLSLPSGYHRDLQFSKGAIFHAFGRGLAALELLPEWWSRGPCVDVPPDQPRYPRSRIMDTSEAIRHAIQEELYDMLRHRPAEAAAAAGDQDRAHRPLSKRARVTAPAIRRLSISGR